MTVRPFSRRRGRRRESAHDADGALPSVRELPSWLGLGVGLLGLATGLMALLLLPKVSHSGLGPYCLAGALISALAGGWILGFHTVLILGSILRFARQRIEVRKEYEFKERGSDFRYLKEVVAYGRIWIGDAHPNETKIMERVKEHTHALRVYVKEGANGRAAFCGYLLLYPLTEQTGRAILGQKIRSESEFGQGPLQQGWERASHLYIAMVHGTDRHARSFVKDRLRTELLRILRSTEIEWVFARPGTPNGLQLMQAYGFAPIGDPQGVWSTRGSQLKARLIAEEAMSSAVLAAPALQEAPPQPPP